MRSFKRFIENGIIIALCLAIVVLFGVIILNKVNNKYDNLIYNGISINGVDLSYKNKSEAQEIIKNELQKTLNNEVLNIKYNEKNYEYTIKNYEGNFEIDKTINDALECYKNNNCFMKFYHIKSDNKKNFVIPYTLTQNGYDKLIGDMEKEIDTKPKNASIVKDGTGFKITPDKKGISIDTDDLKMQIDNALCYNINNEIEVKCNETAAEVTADSLSKIKGLMGSFQTDYSSSSYARSKNIRIVTNEINGAVVMPGQEFSYGSFAKKGIGKYAYAPGYVDGQVVDVEGGGVCQPCTTLYRAIMKCNIKPVERHPHMFMVSYTRPGLDATLGDWGTLDYKFINTYDFPIYIEGIAEGGIVKFNIYGDPAALKNYTYDMKSEVYGLTAKSYLVTYDKNGKEVKREFIASDTYSSH